jgi:hypothetical protein
MKLLSSLLFAGLLLSATAGFAQTDSTFINRANNAIEKQAPIEKVYLHLNKPSYNFSDTIWYKAYTVIGQHHQLSALSGVLYVELISPNDTLVTRQVLKLTSGVAWGDIPLAATLPQGVYRLRAYTKWMRNAGADYFYDQKIRIGGLALNANANPIVQKPDIQFFPEGGELVNGIRSRVAIKAINSKGFGVDVKGVIEDNEGNIVADFATRHLGMGVFAIVPQNGKTYKAKINSVGEAVYLVDLPVAKSQGYTLAINNSLADSLFIKVAVSEDLLKEKHGSSFFVLAQSSGKIYYSAQSNLTGPIYMAGIGKNRFPSGVVQFTLFDSSKRPVAERISFIQGADSLSLQLSAQPQSFQSRQPVKFSIKAAGGNKPAKGTFSVSVINETTIGIDEASASTIFNSLLLVSDLKGNIEQPNYYFSSNPQAKADLDLLMLTQGYRKFEWGPVLKSDTQMPGFSAESSLELAGTVKTMGGKPVPNGKIVLTAPRENLITDTITDSNGNFKFINLEMTDTSKVTLNAKQGNNKSNVKIAVINPGYAEISVKNNINTDSTTMPPTAVLALQKEYTRYQQEQKDDLFRRGRILKEVRIKANRPRQPVLTHTSNRAGAGRAEQVVTSEQLKACANLGSCLIGKIFGLTIGADGVPRSVRSGGTKPVTIVVDGNIMEGAHINDFNVDDVYSIEVLSGNLTRTLYGAETGGDALIITMKNGSEAKPMSTYFSGVITYPFKGFTPTRAFYTPKYSAATPLPDMRETVYWNPNIITDKDGLATIEYLNNDTKGTYRVVVEGIDEEGNLGRQIYKYKVE